MELLTIKRIFSVFVVLLLSGCTNAVTGITAEQCKEVKSNMSAVTVILDTKSDFGWMSEALKDQAVRFSNLSKRVAGEDRLLVDSLGRQVYSLSVVIGAEYPQAMPASTTDISETLSELRSSCPVWNE